MFTVILAEFAGLPGSGKNHNGIEKDFLACKQLVVYPMWLKLKLSLIIVIFALGCIEKNNLTAETKVEIIDRPISFSKWRVNETIKYIKSHYGITTDNIEMNPSMVVVHWTAIYSTETSFKYMNREKMSLGRKKLFKAGLNNIAVHFLVGQDGKIFRLMPENHIGRHVIGLNRHAIGIENVGGPKAPLTDKQLEANAKLIRYLTKKHKLKYMIGHYEYKHFEGTPLFEELDKKYRTNKIDPGKGFMKRLRQKLGDLNLKARYN